MRRLKIINAKFWSAFLGLFGFLSACMPRMEYGQPHADFHLKGKVFDSKTELGIENIAITAKSEDYYLFSDTSYSDSEGDYILDFELFPNNQIITFYFWDVDSSINKQYEARDTAFTFDIQMLEGADGAWYEGSISIIRNIALDAQN